jgi:hypothetical protein
MEISNGEEWQKSCFSSSRVQIEFLSWSISYPFCISFEVHLFRGKFVSTERAGVVLFEYTYSGA